MPTNSSSHPMTPIYWMALGTFAIGTEGFMIAPLLPAPGRRSLGQRRRGRPIGDCVRAHLCLQFADPDRAHRRPQPAPPCSSSR